MNKRSSRAGHGAAQGAGGMRGWDVLPRLAVTHDSREGRERRPKKKRWIAEAGQADWMTGIFLGGGKPSTRCGRIDVGGDSPSGG